MMKITTKEKEEKEKEEKEEKEKEKEEKEEENKNKNKNWEKEINRDNEKEYNVQCYYEEINELKRRMISLEKDILNKEKNDWKIDQQKYNKPRYRSFDEFYEYRKKYEELENKIKRETWKLLNKVKNVERNEDVKKNEETEKYSYTKLKSERKGTVKQLKEFFQKIEEEKKQKRKNALFVKNSLKQTNILKNFSSDMSKSADSFQEETQELIFDIEEGNTSENQTDCTWINEKKKYINSEHSNIYGSENYNKSNHSGNRKITRSVSTDEENREDMKEEEKKKIKNKDQSKEHNEEQNEKKIVTEKEYANENISKEEIELLLKLMDKIKQINERDESYILNLIEELQNSNKRHMIDKMINLLKDVVKTKKEEKTQAALLTDNVEQKLPCSLNNELLTNLTYYENKLKDIEMRIKNIELKSETKSTQKEGEDGMENENENEKKRRDDIKNDEGYKRDDRRNEIPDNESEKQNIVEKINWQNEVVNTPFSNKNQNNNEKLKNRNKKKNNTKNIEKKFDWFYESMDKLCEKNLEIFNEKNMSNEENEQDVLIVNKEIKYYPSDESEQEDVNDALFLWLKEKDVEFVLSQKKEKTYD